MADIHSMLEDDVSGGGEIWAYFQGRMRWGSTLNFSGGSEGFQGSRCSGIGSMRSRYLWCTCG